MSRYETHFHKKRGLNEKNAMDEMEISKNGPSEFRAEKLLVVAMDKYWKKETKSGQWHFTRQSTQNLIKFGVDGSGKNVNKNSKPSVKIPNYGQLALVYVMAADHGLYICFFVNVAVGAKFEYRHCNFTPK